MTWILLRWLGRNLLAFWRLMISVVIGVALYIWTFLEYKDLWNAVHRYSHEFLASLEQVTFLQPFEKWATLLNIDDRLAFLAYVLAARLLWQMVEAPFVLLFRGLARLIRRRRVAPASTPAAPPSANAEQPTSAPEGARETPPPPGFS